MRKLQVPAAGPGHARLCCSNALTPHSLQIGSDCMIMAVEALVMKAADQKYVLEGWNFDTPVARI